MVYGGHLGGGQALAHDGKLLLMRSVAHAASLRLQPLLLCPCICELRSSHSVSARHASDAGCCCCRVILHLPNWPTPSSRGMY
jgi:hypothetical protein